MSKLDEIIEDIDYQNPRKEDIKSLFLELVGYNSSLDDNEVLKFKKELRKKIEEL